MAKLWTSPRTGATYDVTSRDSSGNWTVVSAPFFGSLTALVTSVSLVGGTLLLAGLYIAFATSFIFVGISMAIARWFIFPPILFAICLLLLILPEGRRRWIIVVIAALFSLFVLLPLTFISMYLLGHGYHVHGPQYAWAASMPLVPIMFLIITVWTAIRRSWWVAGLSLIMTIMTGLMSLIPWMQTIYSGEPPAVSSMAMDNILSVLTYGVILIILSVAARQVSLSVERRRLPEDVMSTMGPDAYQA